MVWGHLETLNLHSLHDLLAPIVHLDALPITIMVTVSIVFSLAPAWGMEVLEQCQSTATKSRALWTNHRTEMDQKLLYLAKAMFRQMFAFLDCGLGIQWSLTSDH